MWYTNSYRRNLVDMHIDDWNPEFLSQFDPDAYYDCLVTGKIKAPMIYFQSHAGHCYFPTRLGHMHPAFEGREDMMKRLVDKCRAGGMHVVGYYSLIYNTYEEDRHPEWKIHDGNGMSKRDKGGRYGLCCPNNMEYRAFVFGQIKEMADYFTVDGMFYDMLFWPDICRCEACKARFAKEVGGDIPSKVDWNDERWLAFTRKRREWMGEFAGAVTLETRRLMPGVSVEHNYASAVSGNWEMGSSELVNDACDYTGGDLYGDLYNHSFTCKYYLNVTKNAPFEYMTCRCANNLSQHTVTKSEVALESEIMLTAAHHGASFIIDAIDPCGTMDRRVYERIGKIFGRHQAYEPYFKGEHVADVGVYYSTVNRYNREEQAFTNKECALATVKHMVEQHIPVCVLAPGGVQQLEKMKFVFFSNIYEMEDALADRLIAYVKNGGNLYFSGAGSTKLLKELVGSEYTGEMTKGSVSYLAPTEGNQAAFGEFNRDFPLPFFYKLPIITKPARGVAATLTLPYTDQNEQRFASIHSNPPGVETNHPGLIVRQYGKGKVIWCAAPLELDERVQYKQILQRLLNECVQPQDFTLVSNAPKQVELVTFKTEDSYLVHAVDLRCDEELLPVRPFIVALKLPRKPGKVRYLPDMEPLKYEYARGRVQFSVEGMVMHRLVELLLD